jgi:small subunit ribosomal protein S5
MGRKNFNIKSSDIDFKSKTVCINRVLKATEGGRRLKFSALVVVGNGNGLIGFALGKGGEPSAAVAKGELAAKKNLIKIPILHGTIPHEVYGRFDGSYVFLKPAAEGTNVKAGGVTRIVCKMAGITCILSKAFRQNSKYNILRATFTAFKKLRDPLQIAKERGISLQKLFTF